MNKEELQKKIALFANRDISLLDASLAFLKELNVRVDPDPEFNRPEFIKEILQGQTQSMASRNALAKVKHADYVGIVNPGTFNGNDEVSEDGILFFDIELREDAKVTRSDMCVITRNMNRVVTGNAVVVFFRKGSMLSLATCERGGLYGQLDEDGDLTKVKVGKVSLLRDIDCRKGKIHHGQLDILVKLDCERCSNYTEMYEHWMEVFNVKTLTETFFKELFNWYLWAVQCVKFPNKLYDASDDEKYNHENVIRLICRLLFVWFIKHKGLVNNDLFEESKLKKILKNFNPQDEEGSYYLAILQNLFFATLNCEIGKRKVVDNGKFNPGEHKIKIFFRNNKLFNDPDDVDGIINLFSQTPFVNGGLFECLDNKLVDGQEYCWDGFSNHKYTQEGFLKQAVVPNYLFFAKEHLEEVRIEDEARPTNLKVRGLLKILENYHFTVEESTPLDVDVALDPELLGKVFEELLAAYNPETKTSARKATGSFYTPREIVNYMVDESLLAYLKEKIEGVSDQDLRSVISYNHEDAPEILSSDQRRAIIKALFHCKILDPACGSGAFPMGMLQQICHILSKLDNDNSIWENVVLDQTIKDIKSAEDYKPEMAKAAQEEVRRVFDDAIDNPDYARKLYIIENCIYGVDIQSIAVQISRLRFFISLICEQNRDESKDNFNIKSLPNLETKFVAANTLIPLEKDEETMSLFGRNDIIKKIKRLEEIRHRQFSVSNSQLKGKLRQEDEQLRKEVVDLVKKLYIDNASQLIKEKLAILPRYEEELKQAEALPDVWEEIENPTLFGVEKERINRRQKAIEKCIANINKLSRDIASLKSKAKLEKVVRLAVQITGWNPYDQNVSSPFFDPDWMFGVNDGFDIVIGNPPYVRRTELKDEDKAVYEGIYTSAKKQYDLYLLFTECGIELLKANGHLCFINPIRYFNSEYGLACRKFISTETRVISILDVSQTKVKIFERAQTYPCVTLLEKGHCQSDHLIDYCKLDDLEELSAISQLDHIYISQKDIMDDDRNRFLICNEECKSILRKIEQDSESIKTYYGKVKRGLANSKVNFEQGKQNAIRPNAVGEYFIREDEALLISTVYIDDFRNDLVVLPRTVKYLYAAMNPSGMILLDRIYYLTERNAEKAISDDIVLGILNSRVIRFWFECNYNTTKIRGNYFDLNGEQIKSIPIPKLSDKDYKVIEECVHSLRQGKNIDENQSVIDSILFSSFKFDEKDKKVINSCLKKLGLN